MLEILKPPRTDLDELSQIQNEVAKRIITTNEVIEPDTIAGCDISFAEDGIACAACVLLDYSSLEEIDANTFMAEIDFPYIPTYLAFRELDPMLRAVKEVEADVYMVDSQGMAHPRRAGLASHLGVVIDKPTIGVAKSRLCGEAEEPESDKGSYSFLKDDDETIGAVVRTRAGVKPVYVSVGHKVSLENAIEITLEASPKYKIPEPVRAAHKLATKTMKGS